MDDVVKGEFEKVWKKINELEGKIGPAKKAIKGEIKEDIFEIDGDNIIVTRFLGEKTGDKTKNIALLTLLGYKLKLKQDKVLAKKISDNVAINQVGVENFATHMNKLIPKYVLRFGKPKSTKTQYKLTKFGEAFATKILRGMIDGKKSE